MSSTGNTQSGSVPAWNAAQSLSEIVTRHGRDIVKDPDQLASLLRDQSIPSREAYVLLTAVHDGIPERLTTAKSSIPPEVFRANLVRRLSRDRGIDLDQAAWAITTWATALGLPHVLLSFGSPGAGTTTGGSTGIASRVCPFCASPTDAQQCVSCGRDTSAARKICNKCGKMAPASDAGCWNCGAKFRDDFWWKVALVVALSVAALVIRILIDL